MKSGLAIQSQPEADPMMGELGAFQHNEAVLSILDVVCAYTGMGFAALARVTQDRWMAYCVRDDINFGLKPGGELNIETTLCNEIHDKLQPLVIDHVAMDECYANHQTPAMYGFQSYISVPVMLKDGSFFGTLCAIDPQPRTLTKPETLKMFRLFAQLIAFHVDATLKMEQSDAKFSEQHQSALMREQFIAVLSHDLRNPLGAISAGSQLLTRFKLEPRAESIVTMIKDCTVRMQELIENVCDLARGRLGKGIALQRTQDAPIRVALIRVIDELKAILPERTIITEFNLTQSVTADASRIAQVMSNLLANALKYGATDAPVTVRATTRNGSFEMSVANAGIPIPPATLERLFQPFTRGDEPSDSQGLGLGLYIASEIAKAHTGTLSVTSDVLETRFTLRMPCM